MPNAFQFRSLLGMPPSETSRPASIKDEGSADPMAGLDPASLPASDLPAPPSRANRSQQIRDNLDMLMNQVEHARRDADQMMEEMSALEVSAGLATSLRRENDSLRNRLDDSTRETMAHASEAEGALREINRLKEDLTRIRADYEKSQREASANKLDAERIEDRLRATIASLDEAMRDLEMQREAKDKAEVDAACLRANLAERDRAQSNLLQQETELRMKTARLQSQNDELTDALSRKERSIFEASSQVQSQKDRIADLEADNEASRDELRVLGNKYSDLKVSQDTRLYSLNDGLNQERDSHRMTRKLLEEARDSNELLSDEVAALKAQGLHTATDQKKAQAELSSSRTQLREYGDKLKEAHFRLAAAEGDIQRLENALEAAKKDAISLRRQAGKSDQLLRENTDLHDKVASMQERAQRYRGSEFSSTAPSSNSFDNSDLMDDVPLILPNAKRASSGSAGGKKSASARVASSGQNVARIARR